MGFCEYVVKIVTMSTRLHLVVNAEGFSRGLPDRAAVRGEWQKTRRMKENAALLVDYVLPHVPLGNGY
jgi:hypothetical protein